MHAREEGNETDPRYHPACVQREKKGRREGRKEDEKGRRRRRIQKTEN